VIFIALLALVIIYTPRILMALKEESEFVFKLDKKTNKNYTVKRINKKTNYSNNKQEQEKDYFTKNKSKYLAPPSKFNPNQYERKDWLYLGLSEKQTDVILNFLKSGIKSNNDLKKIYVLPNEVYQLIKDSTYYDGETKLNQNKKKDIPLRIKKELLEINTSSFEELIQLKGIGKFFASQIIKRREQLGGFVLKEQLLEVWKLDSNIYGKLQAFVFVDTLHIKKIDLNSSSKEELQKHPYFRWNQANSIVQMRKQKGKFEAISDILQSKLINDSLYQKVKSYLKVE